MAEFVLIITKTSLSNLKAPNTLKRHCAVQQACKFVHRELASSQARYRTFPHTLQTD